MKEKMSAEQIKSGLQEFVGSCHYYRHTPCTVLTDGTAWLANEAGAFWLMDIIASYQAHCRKDSMLREIQFWKLTINPDKSARVTCLRDEGNEAFHQDIEYSDFPLPEITLYVEPLDERQSVILLPSEH